MVKKLLALSFFLFPLICNAEQTKTKFNPFTGKLDFITQLSTTSVAAGSNITVTTTSAGVSIASTGGGGSTNGTILASTPTNVAVYSATTTVTGYSNLTNDGTMVTVSSTLPTGFFTSGGLNIANSNSGLGQWYAPIIFSIGGSPVFSMGYESGLSGVGAGFYWGDVFGTGVYARLDAPLTASKFVKTGPNLDLISYDLFAGTNVYTGGSTLKSTTTFNGVVAISSSVHLSGSVGTSGQVLTSGGDGAIPTWTNSSGSKPPISYNLDGGGVVISSIGASVQAFYEVPYAITITSYTLSCDVATSTITLSVSSNTVTTFAAGTAATSICASACPALSSARRKGDGTLSGWTTAFVAGDYLVFDLVTAVPQAAKRCLLQLWVN